MKSRPGYIFTQYFLHHIACIMNQSSEPVNKATLWKCEACGYVDTQSHLIYCPAFKDIREGKNLESDNDLVDYFSKVIKIREEIDKA